MKDQLFYRSFEIDERKVNKEERSVSVSFSSDTPVKRWFGDEILLHGKGNVDLSRLRSMGSVLMNHNANTIIGPIRNVSIDTDKRKGNADIVFDDDEDGNRAMGKVASGSLRGVSVGYMINKFREVRRDEEYELEDGTGRKIKGPAMVATRWTPYEISLTPIPADASVGVGRSATRSLDGIEIERSQIKPEKEQDEMDEKEIRAIVADALSPENLRGVIAQLQEAAKPQLRVDAGQLSDLLSRAATVSPETMKEVAKLTGQGKTEAEILRFISDEAIKAAGGQDSTNTQPSGGDRKQETVKVDKLPDDEFLRMLTNPSSMPFFD